ncbi:MAG: STAS domain-containing protein [bacterium]
MDFFAENIKDLPSLTYMAAVGRCSDNIGDEVITRVQRIRKTSPHKKHLALDMRGVTEVEASHFEEFQKIEDTLRQFGWKFYICNIPRSLKNIFNSGKFQKQLNIYQNKSNLVANLKSNKSESARKDQPEPITVVFRTSEGIRLFEALAIDYYENGQLETITKDKNAAMFEAKNRKEATLYFDSPKLQILPQTVQITKCDKIKHPTYNYRLQVDMTSTGEDNKKTLKSYFG